ncbi:MAG: hypothetical protein KAH33_00945, partial [Candidatus Delongbacteria bacterium]|nr:hypothetical protein [Candidatus Delongbacteria bacterium]
IKASEMLLSKGVDNTITILPEGEDPDTFTEKFGNEALQELMDSSLNLIDFKLKVLGSVDKVDAKIAASRSIIESLKVINDELILEQYINEAADKLNVEVYLIRNALKKGNQPRKNRIQSIEPTEKYITDKKDLFEFNILYLMLSNEKVCSEYLRTIDESYFLNHEATQLYMKFYELYEEGESINLNNILVDFDDKFKDFFIDYTASQESVFLADVKDDDETAFEDKICQAFKDSFKKISERISKRKIKQLTDQLKFTSDFAEQDRIMNEIAEIKRAEVLAGNNNK